MDRKITDAVTYLADLRVGDVIAVTDDGRTYDMTVTRPLHRSDGQYGSYESSRVTVSLGVGPCGYRAHRRTPSRRAVKPLPLQGAPHNPHSPTLPSRLPLGGQCHAWTPLAACGTMVRTHLDKEITMARFELKVDGKRNPVTWSGSDGEDAARRYVDCCGGTVIAWRKAPGPLVSELGRGVITG